MNTKKLEMYMLSDPYIRSCYGGVLALDQLPIYVANKPKIYIVNTEKSSESGEHWISIYLSEVPEYYDSLAKIPLKEFENFLVINGPSYLRNTKQIQSNSSSLCGLYCLHFAYFRTR